MEVLEKTETMWWLNEESQNMLNRGYLLKGETVKTAIERVAMAAARRLFKPEMAESFIELIE
ncbi:MAG: ribonucleotide-diphosphate reductase subunit alpha, partial [Bacteroidota bacterium]